MSNMPTQPWTNLTIEAINSFYQPEEIIELYQYFNLSIDASQAQNFPGEYIVHSLAFQQRAVELLEYMRDGRTAPLYYRGPRYQAFKKLIPELKKRATVAWNRGNAIDDPILREQLLKNRVEFDSHRINNQTMESESPLGTFRQGIFVGIGLIIFIILILILFGGQ